MALASPAMTAVCPNAKVTVRKLTLIIALVVLVLGGGLAWRGSRAPARASAPAVHVALGASDAVGIGATRPATEGWVPLVTAGLPEATQLLNLGVSGATLADVLRDQLPVAVDAEARWVTLWPGPNDFRNGVPLATFTQQLDQLLAALQATPATSSRSSSGVNRSRTIAVVTMPDLRALPSFARSEPTALDARVREWNAAIAAVVGRHAPAAILVDLYGGAAEFAARPDYVSADGFHPSTAGYRRIAELVLDVLRRDDPAAIR